MVKTKRFLMLGLAIMLAFAMLVGVLAPVRTVEAEEDANLNGFMQTLSSTPQFVAINSEYVMISNPIPDNRLTYWNPSISSLQEAMEADPNTQYSYTLNEYRTDEQNKDGNVEELVSVLELMCDASGNHLDYENIFGTITGDWREYMYNVAQISDENDETNGITRMYNEGMSMIAFYVKAPSNSGSGGSGSGASAGIETNILVATISVIILGSAITLLSVKKRTNK